MSDHDRTWDDNDNNIAMPPTPGRTLNILPTPATKNRESDSNKAKRRLDLEQNPVLSQLTKKMKPFTIPKKSKQPKEEHRQQQSQPMKPPPKVEKPVKVETKEPELKRPKTEETRKTTTPTEDNIAAKRLKTQAWARILKLKQKLYIPHTSDPRTTQEEEQPQEPSALEPKKEDNKPIVIDDKENTSITVNVVANVMKTPVKITDYNSIIKFMSITPQLLSPLSENPRIFK